MAPYENADAAELGDDEAADRMRMIYQVHSRVLMRRFLAWTYGDRQHAEDLMQETMVRAWRHLATLDTDPNRLRSWLLTVGRRIAIDSLRARAVRPPETEADKLERIPASAEPFNQVLDRSVLRDAMAGLSSGHRAVLSHVYLLDQTVLEASRALGIPEGTAKSRLHHALRAVRAALTSSAEHERAGAGPILALCPAA